MPHMGIPKKLEPVDSILQEMLEITYLDKSEPRRTRLEISLKCNQTNCETCDCKVDKIIKEHSYNFGKLTSEKVRPNVRVYKFNTSIMPCERWESEIPGDVHIEEGWTTIALYREDGKCRVRVYTQAVPGNGGLASVDMRPLKKLEYT